MNTRHLEEFIELGKQLNFSSAAREMYVSQPTLSQHIAMMEEEMGFQLVTREGSVELTPEGAEFFSMAQDVVNRCETARTRCRNLSQGGPKTVRVPDILSTFPVGRMLDQVVGDLYAQDPVSQVIVRKVDYGRHDPMSLLDEDLVDVGFDFSCCGSEHVAQRYRERGYRAFRLLKVPMLVAVPRGHRLESERLLARSLDGETFLSRSNPFCDSYRQAIVDTFALTGAALRPKMVYGSSFFDPPRHESAGMVSVGSAHYFKIYELIWGSERTVKKVEDFDADIDLVAAYDAKKLSGHRKRFAQRLEELAGQTA